jgi:ADP-L-glycero-D-manno-heptose 6-epimerase
MIIVTGGAGFIGSALVWRLNKDGHTDILVVDDFGESSKWCNLLGLKFRDVWSIEMFRAAFLEGKDLGADAIFHLGANSSTLARNGDQIMDLNFRYTKELADYALSKGIRFIYASSAATYGDGNLGFDDDHELSSRLRPLNLYGYSKLLFDNWAIETGAIDNIVGLKYFNVFGPNEYHKDEMKSVVNKAFEYIQNTNKMRLFKSHKPEMPNGDQKRDFVYVKDAVDMTVFFLGNELGGLYNVGTGKARTFNDLVRRVFESMGRDVAIDYFDMPANLKRQYQDFTEANVRKITEVGYSHGQCVSELEESVKEYVQDYLIPGRYLDFEVP